MRAFFLDRDGTLIVHEPYLHEPAAVKLLPGVKSALSSAHARGDRLFLFTNQSGVGRGYFSLEDVHACNARMLDLIGLGPDLFSATCIAPEAPGQPSRYRKPSPHFILEQATRYEISPAHCLMIGDSPSDWEAGIAAGVRAAAMRSDLTTAESESRRISLKVPLFETLGQAMELLDERHEDK